MLELKVDIYIFNEIRRELYFVSSVSQYIHFQLLTLLFLV